MTVRIHDNYIHHNQHDGGHGYGVNVSYGAYALIEKNVFDFNRHAITSDGSNGSGYLAYRNLVLENGGWQDWGYFHTHMFDMHGQDDCWDAGTRDHGLQQRWPDRHPVAPHRRPGCDLVLRGRTVPGRRVSAQGRRELGD
jgi:hypothetical protein